MGGLEEALEIEKSKLKRKCPQCSKYAELLTECKRKCREIYKLYIKYAFANIPRELWALELEDFDIKVPYIKADEIAQRKKTLEDVRYYIKNFQNAYENGLGLIIYGTHGSGKSMLTACVLKEAIFQGKKVLMRDFNDILSYIRKNDKFASNELNIEKEFEEMDVYCIENFGVNQFLIRPDINAKEDKFMRGPNYITREISRLLDKRRRFMSPTIITTYYDIDALKDAQDEEGRQLLSVFFGNSQRLNVPGSDYRKHVLQPNIKQRLANS
jgi:DNA replication protein DnaC